MGRAVRLIRSSAAECIATPFDTGDFLTRRQSVMRPRSDQDMPAETGISEATLRSQTWPEKGRERRARLMRAVEVIGALVTIGFATDNIGREGGGVCHPGSHYEGEVRPSDAHVGGPAPYIDQLILASGGKVHRVWANDHCKTKPNAAAFKRVYNRRVLINNGLANPRWQNWFLGRNAGDIVVVFNRPGATQALAFPEPTARKNEIFMIFGAPNGAQTKANIRKILDATPAAAQVSCRLWDVEL
jgi:anaerobic selenocysteine-containing dehydrogenase